MRFVDVVVSRKLTTFEHASLQKMRVYGLSCTVRMLFVSETLHASMLNLIHIHDKINRDKSYRDKFNHGKLYHDKINSYQDKNRYLDYFFLSRNY